MPPNTVKVDRSTKWGNPFKVHKLSDTFGGLQQDMMDAHQGVCFSAEASVNRFKRMLYSMRGFFYTNFERGWGISVAMIKRELRGRDIACWCNLRECESCGRNYSGRRHKTCVLCGGKVIRPHCHGDLYLEIANS